MRRVNEDLNCLDQLTCAGRVNSQVCHAWWDLQEDLVTYWICGTGQRQNSKAWEDDETFTEAGRIGQGVDGRVTDIFSFATLNRDVFSPLIFEC